MARRHPRVNAPALTVALLGRITQMPTGLQALLCRCRTPGPDESAEIFGLPTQMRRSILFGIIEKISATTGKMSKVLIMPTSLIGRSGRKVASSASSTVRPKDLAFQRPGNDPETRAVLESIRCELVQGNGILGCANECSSLKGGTVKKFAI